MATPENKYSGVAMFILSAIQTINTGFTFAFNIPYFYRLINFPLPLIIEVS